MVSIEAQRLTDVRRRLRWRYEWTRGWRALLGFSPVWILIVAVAGLVPRPQASLLAGGVVYFLGVIWLWRGRQLARAVLPGVGVGLVPLALALAANAMGHVCLGASCTNLCLPACASGGMIAGFVLTRWAKRRDHGWRFWLGGTTLALATGAMGCACVGSAGIVGMVLGYGSGLLVAAARASLISKGS